MSFERETATHEEDLPHRFELDQPSTGLLCTVCSSMYQDPRHKAWEAAQISERAQAHAAFQREVGS